MKKVTRSKLIDLIKISKTLNNQAKDVINSETEFEILKTKANNVREITRQQALCKKLIKKAISFESRKTSKQIKQITKKLIS